jgi:hypothetical protein
MTATMVLGASLVQLEKSPMKTILSALIALSVLAGFAGAAAAAVDAKTFYDQVDRDRF